MYQAYPIALQRAPERLDFLPALVGELRLAKQLQAGSVYINRHADVAPNAPFGGIKGSGLGVKFGQEGLHDDHDHQRGGLKPSSGEDGPQRV